MNLWDYVLLIGILAGLLRALLVCVRSGRKKTACSGNCTQCAGCGKKKS